MALAVDSSNDECRVYFTFCCTSILFFFSTDSNGNDSIRSGERESKNVAESMKRRAGEEGG